MAQIGTIRYLLALIGGVLSFLTGILLLILGVLGGALSTVLVFSPIGVAGFFAVAGFVTIIIFSLVVMFLSYAIVNYAGELKSSRKNKEVYGFLILIFSVVLFFMGAGFGIGPILSGIGGLLIIL